MKTTDLKNAVRTFHSDEDGLEAVQVVMIVAIAAMILLVVSTVGKEAVDWAKEKWNALKGKSIS